MMDVLALFWSFCKIGFTSFGGLSMLPLISSEMEGHAWMTTSEISDIVAIAEMTPGPLGLNCATFAGIRVAGVLGAIASNLGMLMPTFTICALAAVFFAKFQNSSLLQRLMKGVRPACIGLIWATILKLVCTNYLGPEGAISVACIGIGLLACVLLVRFKWSIPKTIALAAVLGLILC